jgi:2-polyprenyl-3-methyl-5-hydroxy-6-metoxy-1,4-benzoquinol methylase
MNRFSFAEGYDLMAWHNPEYRKIQQDFTDFLKRFTDKKPERILDAGAGTGNFSIRAALQFPEAEVWHVESNPELLALAKEKCQSLQLENIRFVQSTIQDFSPPVKFDLLVSVHALYTTPKPKEVLRNLVHSGLNDGAPVFLCDLGRRLNLAKWRNFMVSHLIEKRGVQQTIQIFKENLPLQLRQREISRLQQEGVYWLHSHQAFQKAVIQAGLAIEEARTVYLGDSDLVLARYQQAG